MREKPENTVLLADTTLFTTQYTTQAVRWEAMKMTFYDWMMAKYLSKDTPRGDLAHDMHHDADFPRDDDYDRLLRYLRYRRACTECVALFKRCWRDYQKAMVCHAGTCC